jgi:hypothetical protein
MQVHRDFRQAKVLFPHMAEISGIHTRNFNSGQAFSF